MMKLSQILRMTVGICSFALIASLIAFLIIKATQGNTWIPLIFVPPCVAALIVLLDWGTEP